MRSKPRVQAWMAPWWCKPRSLEMEPVSDIELAAGPGTSNMQPLPSSGSHHRELRIQPYDSQQPDLCVNNADPGLYGNKEARDSGQNPSREVWPLVKREQGGGDQLRRMAAVSESVRESFERVAIYR
jgi:hypothetical protein